MDTLVGFIILVFGGGWLFLCLDEGRHWGAICFGIITAIGILLFYGVISL